MRFLLMSLCTTALEIDCCLVVLMYAYCIFPRTPHAGSPQAMSHRYVDRWGRGHVVYLPEWLGLNCVGRKTPLDSLQQGWDCQKPRDIEWPVSTSQHSHFLWLELKNRATANGI